MVSFGVSQRLSNVSILLLMEMVLEYFDFSVRHDFVCCFNPSSNGNGAGILQGWFMPNFAINGFNPSSNGNGAGIAYERHRRC